MSTNLIQLGLQYLTPDVVARISSALGVDRSLIGKALTAALPALIGSFAGAASKPGGAARLDQAIGRQNPGILDDLTSMIGGSGQNDLIKGGIDALSSVLGSSSVPGLASAIGKFSGLNREASSSLLGMAAPAVLGLLGQQQKEQGLDAQGLAKFLKSQEANVAAAMPAGFGDLLKDADIPGFADAPASSAASRIRSMTPSASAGSSASLWTWLLPIVLVAGVALWFYSDSGTEVAEKSSPIQTGSIEKTLHPSNLAVDGKNLGQAWDTTLKGLTTALGTITDPASAQSALPKLDTANSELQQISKLSNELPSAGRSALAALVAKARPSIEEVFTKVLEIPGVSAVAEPVIAKLREHLDKLAQA